MTGKDSELPQPNMETVNQSLADYQAGNWQPIQDILKELKDAEKPERHTKGGKETPD